MTMMTDDNASTLLGGALAAKGFDNCQATTEDQDNDAEYRTDHCGQFGARVPRSFDQHEVG